MDTQEAKAEMQRPAAKASLGELVPGGGSWESLPQPAGGIPEDTLWQRLFVGNASCFASPSRHSCAL